MDLKVPSTYDMFPITEVDKLSSVKREIRMREEVYPRWVREGRMTQDKADREIAVMKAIQEDYEAQVMIMKQE